MFCRKADDGLQKVSQTGQEMHMTPRDITNKHIMAYGNEALFQINHDLGII